MFYICGASAQPDVTNDGRKTTAQIRKWPYIKSIRFIQLCFSARITLVYVVYSRSKDIVIEFNHVDSMLTFRKYATRLLFF